ncbi:MAG TPA: glycoside hydrolase family 2 protein [Mycobacteriales bacterium]|nr:glycoside hydrolase family 2 protein [Mycobacteriales bacterium]
MTTARFAVSDGRYVDADPAQDLVDVLGEDTAAGLLPISLPADVHRQLLADGRIADPDRGDHNEECFWVQDRAWWFRFSLPDVEADESNEVSLIIDRLDTQATVWLNGAPLGTHANAFRPARFDLPTQLRNATLTVRIDPPAKDEEGSESEYATAAARLRKPCYAYGWDFAPVRPSIGIGSITVVQRDRGSIEYVDFRTVSIADSAKVTVNVDAVAVAGKAATVRLELRDPDANVAVVGSGSTGSSITLQVPRPKLWWTHDRGEPALYTLRTDLVVDGEVVDTDVRRVGIRTIELDQSADTIGGQHFRFILNGEAVASLGANWAPSGLSAAAPDDTRAHRYLTLARDAGMSMLRIWGGGYYETDLFYELCDELGILIFHDFMFANREYPVDEDYLAEVEREATHQVRRLVSHPCMALWCGSNEIEAVAAIYEWPELRVSAALFHALLPRVVAANSDLGYIGSSPCEFNAHDKGDRHNWQVWHGVDVDPSPETRAAMDWYPTTDRASLDDPMTKAYVAIAHPRRYLDDVTRFVSEYGLGSYCWYSTLEKWLDPEALQIDHPQLFKRSRPGRFGPFNKVEIFLDAMVGVPADLPSYVRATQLMQAEGIKLGTEHFRRLWPICSGELLWQLNDCWPSISWALVDTELRPKPAWYYTRRFFAPFLASVKPVDGGVELWLTNNGRVDIDEDLTIRTTSFTGDVLWSAQISARSEANTSRAVGTWSLEEIEAGASSYLTVAGRTTSNRHFFTDVVEMERTTPPIDVDVTRSGDRLDVTVGSDALALMVTVTAGDALFDDNCFDLHPGHPRTVTAYGVPEGTNIEILAN